MQVDNKERFKEKISLLMRLFWLDKIYEIGKTLKIPYFDQFSNYWEINHYQGALEIAKVITDKTLLEIVKKHPPKYGVSLGGFRGKFYTVTEDGQLYFKGSWDEVRKSVQKALAKWGDKAYGVLQALINKNGRSAYFDLIEEIEKVLGYEFAPSYLLPRLSSMKLVFKTGSNKYPDWTLPSEIIPVVQEELKKFKRPMQPAVRKAPFSNQLMKLERKGWKIVDKIADLRRRINQVFQRYDRKIEESQSPGAAFGNWRSSRLDSSRA